MSLVPILEGLITKGPGMVLGYLFIVSQPNLVPKSKDGFMTANGVLRSRFSSIVRKMVTSLKDLSPWPS